MLALIFATLTVIAPGGWVEDQTPATGYGVESVLSRPPGDPATFYLVMRLGPNTMPEAVIARVLDDLPTGVTHDSKSSDRGIEIVRKHDDQTWTHIRVLRGSDPGALVGICHGHGTELVACRTKLDLLTVRIERTDVGYVFDLLLWLAIGIVVVGLAGYGILVVLRRRRLASSPQLQEGTQLTISGVVQRSNASLEAALSGKPCVMHRSRARVLVHERLISEPSEVQIRPFVVETRHGPVRIDVRELALEVPPDTVVDLATERQIAFRSRHDIPKTASVAFDEIVIEPGSKVSIQGIVALERDPDATAERGYRDDAPTTIQLVGAPAKPLTLLKIW